MDPFLQEMSVLTSSSEIGFVGLILNSGLSLLFGIFISYVYRWNTSSFSMEAQFSFTLVIICMVVASVMAVIGSNLTLSLGLIGALSIIRFRSVVKNTVDMAYLFWSIALGLSVGAGQYKMGVTSALVIGAVITLTTRFNLFKSYNDDYIVTIQLPADGLQEKLSQVFQEISPNLKFVLKSSTVNKLMDMQEITYSITLRKGSNLDSFLDEIKKDVNIQGVTVLSPETNLYL
jgi:uncharacterized membrane protein YhiD involved in acid resistance